MNISYIGFVLFLILSGCNKTQQAAPPPRPALVMVVGDEVTATNMALVGEVRPRFESRQGFRINGKIIERKVDVGERVKKGQVIARLDPADANLTVAAALADVASAKANFALAQAEVNRYRQLFTKKFISSSALDSREAELKTASARLAQAKAQAEVSFNQTQYTNLTADRDGVVTLIHAEPGQVVQAGEEVVRIAKMQEIEVLVAVPESKISVISLHQQVTIRMWANQQKAYDGIIREIAPTADSATRAFNMRVTIKKPDESVKLGMTARITVNAMYEQNLTGYLIPSTALTEINGEKIVWVIDKNNKAQPRNVIAGQFSEAGIMVSNGLQAGEKIAVAGVHTLAKGEQVKPVIGVAP